MLKPQLDTRDREGLPAALGACHSGEKSPPFQRPCLLEAQAAPVKVGFPWAGQVPAWAGGTLRADRQEHLLPITGP